MDTGDKIVLFVVFFSYFISRFREVVIIKKRVLQISVSKNKERASKLREVFTVSLKACG